MSWITGDASAARGDSRLLTGSFVLLFEAWPWTIDMVLGIAPRGESESD